MDLEVLEQKLRSVPGVLDCSVSAEGVAVVVHPEVDPRLIELRAQVLLAEVGDRRPLLVVGGMTVGPRVLPSGRAPRSARAARSSPSPLSLAGFALLVLALLAVVPIAGRDAGSGGGRSPSAAQGDSTVAGPTGLGRVPVADEAEPSRVVAAPAPAPAEPVPVDAEPAEAALVVAAAESGDAGALGLVHLASAPSSQPEGLAAPRAPEGAAPAAFDAQGKGGPAGGKDSGKGHGRGKERRSEVRAAGGGGSVAMAAAAPADRPGRRRGHHR